MARGTASKEIITNKLLETFKGSFKYDKEIRVPIEENGEVIQIKITLTAAKTNVDCGGDVALPGDKGLQVKSAVLDELIPAQPIKEPTQEEKSNLANLMATLF